MKNKIKIIAALLFFLSFEMTALSKSRPRPMPKSPEKIDLKKWSELRGSAYGKSQTIKGMLPNSPYPTSKNHIDFSEKDWNGLKKYMNSYKVDPSERLLNVGDHLIKETFSETIEKLNLALRDEKKDVIEGSYLILNKAFENWKVLEKSKTDPADSPLGDKKMLVAGTIEYIIRVGYNKEDRVEFRNWITTLSLFIKGRNENQSFYELLRDFITINSSKSNIDFSETNWKELKSHINLQKKKKISGSFAEAIEKLDSVLFKEEDISVIESTYRVLNELLWRWEELKALSSDARVIGTVLIEKQMLATVIDKVLTTKPLFASKSEMKDFRRDIKFLARSIDKEEKDITVLLMKLNEAYRTGDFISISISSSKPNFELFSEANWKELKSHINLQKKKKISGSFAEALEKLDSVLYKEEDINMIENTYRVLDELLWRWEELKALSSDAHVIGTVLIEKQMLAIVIDKVLTTEPLFASKSEMKDFKRDMIFLARSIDKAEKDITVLLMELKEAYRTGDFSNIYKQMPY